ncbi:hypothetical protein AVEN_92362-1 [Araneus ventricosus]|uniref:Uncharacterized protein n=1 Tax=Araneus ventricosus TaxID=182803 RepID=A0A4Y2AIJ1_ARAVE|nr:hypothetical protein AVEN_92362-1 [Araneus ventricosus]
MEKGQEEMKKGQEEMNKEMKNQIQGVKVKIEEVKDEVQRKIEEVEGKVQKRIEGVEDKVQRKMKEVEDKVRGKIGEVEEKVQFDVVSSANGWNNLLKASQLVATLRGSAAEVLQGISSEKLKDLTTIEKALEARFGDSHLTQFYRTELKTRRQKPGQSLQVLAAYVERLMSLAYAECPQDARDSLSAQYFVDAIRNEDTQLSTRLMDFTDLKSALAYSMKYEASKIASKIFMHTRPIRIEDNASKRKDVTFESIGSVGKIIGQTCCWIEKRSSTESERDLLEVL